MLSSSETKSQFESKSMQKISLSPVKKAEYGWRSPRQNRVSLFRGSAPAGAMMHVPLKHRSTSQWNLNKVKWRTLYKRGCRQFHPNNTNSKEQRDSRETASLSLLSPSLSFLVFHLSTSVTRRSFHSTLFQGFGESNLKKTPLVGRGVQPCQR